MLGINSDKEKKHDDEYINVMTFKWTKPVFSTNSLFKQL